MREEAYLDPHLDPKTRAKDLLGRMNLREKVGQLNQTLYGFRCYEKKDGKIVLSDELINTIRYWGGLGVLYGLFRTDPWTQKDLETGLAKEEMLDVYRQIQELVLSSSRFKIPVLLSEEAPHGHVSLDSYMLPVNLAVGASFNPDLYRDACRVAGEELKNAGVDLALVSMLDMLRDPRWGRSEECYGEDPYLSSQMAKAAIEGYRSSGTEVIAKVFTAHGEGVGGINAGAVNLGRQELHEIHMPPVIAAHEAGAAGVMAAYNEIDGLYCHANSYLLRTVLRDEIGFEGIVMADGLAIDRINLMTGGDSAESAAIALRAGVDLSLWDVAYTRLEEAVERHPELEQLLDEACERMLRLKFSCGLFDRPLPTPKPLPVYPVEDYPQSLELARQSIVLLKNNDNLLPLEKDKTKTTALIGPHIRDTYTMCGDYTPYLRAEQCVTIEDAFAIEGPVLPEEGCGIRRRSETALSRAREIANRADRIVLVLGGSSSRFGSLGFAANGALEETTGDVDCGEGADLSDISLAEAQLELFREIRAISNARGIPLVTIIVAGRPYAIEKVAAESDALLYSVYPGPMGGRALAEVVYGLSPSGRLPFSLPRSNLQIPCYYNRKASYQPRYLDLDPEPFYRFGYGLTYASFSVEAVSFSSKEVSMEHAVDIKLSIRNNGKHRAAVVPQLYIRQHRSARVPRVLELKAFGKCFIDAGKAEEVTITLQAKELKVWLENQGRVIEEGAITVSIQDQGELLWEDDFTVKA